MALWGVEFSGGLDARGTLDAGWDQLGRGGWALSREVGTKDAGWDMHADVDGLGQMEGVRTAGKRPAGVLQIDGAIGTTEGGAILDPRGLER